MSASETLKKAKLLIEDPSHWVQKMLTTNSMGQPVSLSDESADKWCATGAILRVGYNKEALDLLSAVCFEAYGLPIPLANDRTDHPTMMKMFDRAIQLAEEKLIVS